jgi:general secretion pathway protein M
VTREARLALPALATWHARASTRERLLVGLAVIVVVGALAYTFAWQPLVRDIARLHQEVPRLQALLEQARQRAAGLPDAPVAPARVGAAELRALVDRTLNEKGLRGQVDALEARDDGVHVVFSGVAFGALVGWLDELSKQHGLRPIEATLTARVEPGTVRADLVLVR